MLIDTHAHLTDEKYSGAENIIKNMSDDNLSAIISVGYDIESSDNSKILAEKHKNIYFAAGVHPCNTYEVKSDYLDKLKNLSKHEKCVAIGEIGLDYHYDDTDKNIQRKILMQQLEVLKDSNLPAILHVRDSDADMLDIVKQNISSFTKQGVLHCFSGSKETALSYIDLGFYISFTGVITFKNAKKFPDIISSLPRDKVLVETDCPYLCPEPFRGSVNEPKMTKYVALKIAEIWGVSEAEVADITTQNAKRLFSKIKG